MSQDTGSSARGSEPVAPTPPPAKGGMKLWVVIVAVVIVAALLVAGLWVAGIIGKGKITDQLEAVISPSSVVVSAGKDVSLTVTPTWKGVEPTKGTLKYNWSAVPETVGSFNLVAQKAVTYTAGKSACTGTIKCNVTYKYDENHLFYEDVSVSLTINPPVMETVVIVPSTRTLTPGNSTTFFVSAYNSVDVELEDVNVSYSWSVANMTDAQYDITAMTGNNVTFTALAVGEAWLNATATDSTGTALGSAKVNVIDVLPARSADYRWYDLFEVPNGVWWDVRWEVTGDDEPLTNTYPYLYRWWGSPTNTWLYTSMRLNITGENMYEINMNSRPEFLPMFGNYRGGNADIRWYMQFMTPQELPRYPAFIGSWLDGWVTILNGTATLDKEAAMTVMGIKGTDFDENFDAWWVKNREAFKLKYNDWLSEEGKVRLNIYNMYEYPYTVMYFEIDADKVGNKVVLTYDIATWGMEALMAKWFREAKVIPTEWYFEDFHFNATIGPESTDMNVDTVVEYAAYAYETTLESLPCWEWEALLQDVVPASPMYPISDYTPYANRTYVDKAPGADAYGTDLIYDYTPGVWNLSAGETFTLEWPSGPQLFVKHGGDDGWNTTHIYGNMEVRYAEPMDSDMPSGQFTIDNTSRRVTFKGPFDMWNWSKNQATHQSLADEWDRLGILPYGMPTIELAMELAPRYPARLSLEDVQSPIELNAADGFVVRVLNQYGGEYPFYNGTVRFFSNDTAAVLPPDYEFANEGNHTFSVTFNTKGYANLSVVDVANASIYDTQDMIEVGPEPAMLEIQNAPVNAMKDAWFSLRVTCYDDFGNVHANYTGTVHFTTTDDSTGVVLPADYTFTASDAGTHMFNAEFKLQTLGMQAVAATDSAFSTHDMITLEIIPKQNSTRTYTIYDMFQEPWGEWWSQRWPKYQTDVILTNESGMYTAMFLPGINPAQAYQALIYAPYRFAIDARNQTGLSVDRPEFMPVLGSPVAGASANVNIYFQYLNTAWWTGYWIPTWGTDPAWVGDTWYPGANDGYYMGTKYTVTMNRQAAQEWLNMSQSANATTWWAANKAEYVADWQNWVDDEGNNRLDIFCGYDWTYDQFGTYMNLVEGADGNVTLSIAHLSWGYEVLMTRWLAETKLSSHEPWYEDFTLNAGYWKYAANVTTDGVAQYSLHAVKANGTTDGAAWVWEPNQIDYITKMGHPSKYKPYSTRTYQSWNAGDVYLGTQVPYEQTPYWFNLTVGDKLIIQLPPDTAPGYSGVALTEGDIDAIVAGDKTALYSIMANGTMSLGYFVTGWPLGTGVDLVPLYNAGTRTLTITGPVDFNNFWHTATGVLYHGAPWIEFNVTLTIPITATAPQGTSASGPVVSSSISELLALAVVVSATILAVTALGASARRRY